MLRGNLGISISAFPSPVTAVIATGLLWTLLLGGMALGGMVFGMYGAQRPFSDGIIRHPLFYFCVLGVLAILVLRFAGDRPLVSDRALIAGVVVGAGAYLLGVWFGVSLLPVR